MGIIIRQSIKGTIVTYAGTFIGFLTTFFVLTRFLTAEEIGLTRVLIDAATMLIGLAQLGTNSSIVRFYPYFRDAKNRDHGFFFWTLIVPLLGFAVFGLLYILLRGWVSGVFSDKSEMFVNYYYFVLPLAFFMLYQAVFETNANVLMRIVVPRFVREVGVRLLSLVVYLLYAFNVLSLNGFVAAFCSVYAVAALCNFVYLLSLKQISLKPDLRFLTRPLMRDYGFYTLFLVTTALGSALSFSLSSFFVSAKMGLAYTGVYAIAMYISTMISIPYRSLGAIAQPNISQAMKEGNTPEANRLSKSVSLHQLLAGAFVFFAIWINIDLIFNLLPNGEQYAAGKWVVFILGFSQMFSSAFSVGTSVLSYSKYYYYSLGFSFLLTGLSWLFNSLFVPQFGINGAAVATMLSNIIYYLLLLAVVAWRLKTSPFSGAQLKVLLVIAALLVGNTLWTTWLTPLIYKLINAPELMLNLCDSVIRSLLLLLCGVLAVYKWHISPEVNSVIDLCLSKLKFFKK